MKIGEIIRKLRLEKSMGQKELAEAMNVGRNTVSMWESCLRSPSRDKMEKLATIFNVDIDYMYGRSEIRRKVDFTLFDNDLSFTMSPSDIALLENYHMADEETQKTVDRLLYYSAAICDYERKNKNGDA